MRVPVRVFFGSVFMGDTRAHKLQLCDVLASMRSQREFPHAKTSRGMLTRSLACTTDFIITQMFFDTNVYVQFVKDCRAIGIQCPIVPGLMCLTGKAGFYKMARFCRTRIPDELRDLMANVTAPSNNDTNGCDGPTEDEQVKAIGIAWGVRQCRELVALPTDVTPPVLHFYTLNLEKVVTGILQQLGRLPPPPLENNKETEAVQAAS
jgi:5,10-methylenetetrahydrofolate reductase